MKVKFFSPVVIVSLLEIAAKTSKVMQVQIIVCLRRGEGEKPF